MKVKTALILCAGFGKRLNPITLEKPKPLIELNNTTLLENTLNLIKKIPDEFIIVAESGIKSKKDIDKYNEAGIFNFLIGESILKSTNINDKIKELLK